MVPRRASCPCIAVVLSMHGVLPRRENCLLFSTADRFLSVWIDTWGRRDGVVTRHDLPTGSRFLGSLMATSPLRKPCVLSGARVSAMVSRVEIVEGMKEEEDGATGL
jgi:hypothetical protein